MAYEFEVKVPIDPRLLTPEQIDNGEDKMVIKVEEVDRMTFCAQVKNIISLIEEGIIR